MYEQPSVVPSDHGEAPEPELIAAILARMSAMSNDGLLAFVPGQLRASA